MDFNLKVVSWGLFKWNASKIVMYYVDNDENYVLKCTDLYWKQDQIYGKLSLLLMKKFSMLRKIGAIQEPWCLSITNFT